MSLPLQPGTPTPPWITGLFLVLIGVTGLSILGAAGVQRHTPASVVLSGPRHGGEYAAVAERMIARARQRIWVMQFVIRRDEDGPVAGLLGALAAARARGVEVRAVLDRGPLHGTDRMDDRNDEAAAWLGAHGIPVLWDEVDRTTHAKILVCDETALVGSHNWTRSALTTNREASVRLSGQDQIAPLEDLFRSVPGW